MNIREKITEMRLKNCEYRLCRFIEIGAPEVMIERAKEVIAELKNGKIDINDKGNILGETYVNHEVKTGRGGKKYVSFNDGTLNSFPEGKYGPFTSRNPNH